MAYHFYLAAIGQKQGRFIGSAIDKQYKGQIVGLAMNHLIASLRDPTSGLSTGKRVHQPLAFTKAWDQSTPKLLSALVENEALPTCTFTFLRPDGNQLTNVAEFTISLVNAAVTSITQYTANPDQVNQFGVTNLEDVTLTYQKIVWTWIDGNITAEDDWLATP